MKRLALRVAIATALFPALAVGQEGPSPASPPLPSLPPPAASSTGAAPPLPETAPPPPVVEPGDDPDAAFRMHYALGRASLLNGDFAAAEDAFGEAAAHTADPWHRRLAEEDRSLAHEWTARNLAFVNRSALGESGLTAKAVGVRTGDEIVSLYTTAVIYGVGTGLWIDALTGANQAAAVTLPPLLFAGASAGLVGLLDSGKGLKYGAGQAIVSGMWLGLEEGVVLAAYQGSQASNWSAGGTATFIWATSTAGAVAGGVAGATLPMTPGRASYVGSAGLWTGALGGLFLGAVTQDDGAPWAGAAIGVAAGAVAGIVSAGPVSPSVAHVRFIDLGGIVGVLAAGGLYLAASGDNVDPHALSGAAALGAAGGLVTAFLLTRSMPKDDEPAEHLSLTTSWSPSIAPVPGGAAFTLRGSL